MSILRSILVLAVLALAASSARAASFYTARPDDPRTHWQRIYKWSNGTRQLSTVADQPLDPVNLAIDKSGSILIASYTGKGRQGRPHALHPGTGLALRDSNNGRRSLKTRPRATEQESPS
jgi:hypothetical protein